MNSRPMRMQDDGEGLATGAERPRVPVLFPSPGLRARNLTETPENFAQFRNIRGFSIPILLLHLLELCVCSTASISWFTILNPSTCSFMYSF